jgi:hypothetical protein
MALGVRGLRGDLPLWTLVLAAQGPDWVAAGVAPFATRQSTALWSHAFPWVLVPAGFAAALCWAYKGSLVASLTVLLVYLSHSLLDYVTGYKVLWVGGPRIGLLIVEKPGQDFFIQALLCLVGWALYRHSLAPGIRRRWLCILPLAVLLSLQGFADLVLGSAHRRLVQAFTSIDGRLSDRASDAVPTFCMQSRDGCPRQVRLNGRTGRERL